MKDFGGIQMEMYWHTYSLILASTQKPFQMFVRENALKRPQNSGEAPPKIDATVDSSKDRGGSEDSYAEDIQRKVQQILYHLIQSIR